MDAIYIICDERNRVMSLDGIKMYGLRVSIPAMFNNEDDALNILFEVEKLNPGLPPHRVSKMAGTFTGQEL